MVSASFNATGSVPRSAWGDRAVVMPSARYSREMTEAYSKQASGENSAAIPSPSGQCDTDTAALLNSCAVSAGPLRGSLEAFVGCICDLVARHPWLPPLWIREVVSEGGGLRELLTTRLMPELASLVAARFAAEQAAGRLNSGLEPRLLLVSLVGLTLLPAAGMPIWRQLFAAEELGVDAIRTHALALLERGLELPA